MSTEAKKAKSDGEGGEIKQDLPLEWFNRLSNIYLSNISGSSA